MSKSQCDEDVIAGILLAWEEAFERGQDIPAASLCGVRSDLVTEVRKRIELLRSVGWLIVTNATTTNVLPKRPILPVKRPNLLAGRYELKEHLGSGGFGEVWRAYDNHLGRAVAVKMPHKGRYPNDSEARNRFLAEAQRVAKLNHPGIVKVYDVSQHEGSIFIISELIDGEDVSRRMKRMGRLPIREAVRIVIEAANNLHYAHQHSFIHRDIKPANLLIQYDGKVFITDFGIAISTDEPNTVFRNYGTLPYMAPERQLHNAQQIDMRSDVYSLGVVLYELLTSYLPSDYRPPVKLKQGQGSELTSPKTIDSSIPTEIDRICLKCLATLPSDRYQSAADLASDLTKWQIQQEDCSFFTCTRWLWTLVWSEATVDTQTHKVVHTFLEDRAKAWAARPETRLLPSLMQSLCIYWITVKSNWTPVQAKMVSNAFRFHAKKALMLILLLIGSLFMLSWAWRSYGELESTNTSLVRNYEESERIRKEQLLSLLIVTPITEVGEMINKIDTERSWLDPKLHEIVEHSDNRHKKLNASLALIPKDPNQAEYLFKFMLDSTPEEFRIIKDNLSKYSRTDIVTRSWELLLNTTVKYEHRFRAACLLASNDANYPFWYNRSQEVTAWLLKQPKHELLEWADLFTGIKGYLTTELLKVFHNPSCTEEERDKADMVYKHYNPLAKLSDNQEHTVFPEMPRLSITNVNRHVNNKAPSIDAIISSLNTCEKSGCFGNNGRPFAFLCICGACGFVRLLSSIFGRCQ